MQTLTEAVQQLVYDTTVGSRVIQDCHWNLQGVEFIPMHKYLGDLYDELIDHMDTSAEFLKFLGETPISCLSQAVASSIIKGEEGNPETMPVLQRALAVVKVLKAQAEVAAQIADENKNMAATEVFGGISSSLDQAIYFLSHSEGHSVYKKKIKPGHVGIAKKYDAEQLTFGWASVARNPDGSIPIDWADDVIDIEDIELPMYDYVMKSRELNEMHAGGQVAEIVEMVVFTKEKMAAMGIPEGIVPEGVWIGAKVHNKEVFNKVKTGEYKMYSIEGSAVRVPIED